MTFEEELASLEGKESLEDVSALKIGNHLKGLAATDPSIARNLQKDNKSLSECYKYVRSEVGKLVKSTPIVMTTDEPVYEMAIHYYDEDSIKLEPEKPKHEPVKEPISKQEPDFKPVITQKAKVQPTQGQESLF